MLQLLHQQARNLNKQAKCSTSEILQKVISKKTKGLRSEQTINTSKILGFKKFDKVSYQGNYYFIKGRMSTGYAILMDIFGKTQKFENPKTVKLKDCKRIRARRTTMIQRTSIHPLS